MAAIDDLIAQIEDKALRERLRMETNRITKEKKFGLVFEDHLPELTPIYSAQVRKHSKVGMRGGPLTDLWRVLSVRDGEAHCRNIGSGETRKIPVDDLVVVRQFGEPIFPALAPVDKVQNGPDDAPWHTLIEADNYHALQLLEYLYAGKVDCIYIDPPYNSGARDWKYNNDYVDANDAWRHSKWLAMMQRRLRLAKRLLNPKDSVLIVTFDEKEYLRLGLLLEQIFPDANIQMVTSAINATGTIRVNEFTRVNEYLFFVLIGESRISPDTVNEANSEVPWNLLQRREMPSRRGGPKPGPDQFYPIYIDLEAGKLRKIGEPIPTGVVRSTAPSIKGCLTLFPLKPDGTEMTWGLNPGSLKKLHDKGFVKVTKNTRRGSQGYSVYYLTSGKVKALEDGLAEIVGKNPDGSVRARYIEGQKAIPTTMWMRDSHNAQSHGTKIDI
ncbi:MAG: DNA methyltransferase [Pseudomonadota bacterium]|nr:DNA methyltransferase [Pseudomonadota bacterium]